MEPWGGLWGALGRLGAAFLGDLVAHRFFVVFLSILGRFWDGFWYQKSMEKRIENEADFEVFFDVFCDGSVSFLSQCVL